MNTESPTIGWLLEADGTVTRLIAARKQAMFNGAVVTHVDGSTQIVSAFNVLSPDNLDERLFWPARKA